MSQQTKLSKRLALTTALAGVLFASYGGRSAYAGTCPGAAGTYTCSGVANSGTDVTQNLSSTGILTVTTTAGFGIDTSTSGGHALNLYVSAAGTDLNFIDTYTSPVTGENDGIFAYNYGNGTLSITTNGTVTGNSRMGISARNRNLASTDLTINAQGNVTGNATGIYAHNYGTGPTSITTTAAVTGQNYAGIYVVPEAGDLSVTVAAGSVVTGSTQGIDTNNYGTGMSTITVNGSVAANFSGILLNDDTDSGPVSITVGAMGSIISDDDDGIDANADGIGDLTTVVNGRVIGYADAIDLNKDGSGNIMVTTGVGAYLSGGRSGLATDISDTGGTTNITVNGTEIIAGSYGIRTVNRPYSGNTTITVDATSTITAGYDGIFAERFNNGNGNLTINAQGDVISNWTGINARNAGAGSISITTTAAVTGQNYDGIYVSSYVGDLSVTVAAGSVVTGDDEGIDVENYSTGMTTVTVNGTVNSIGREGIEVDDAGNSGPVSITVGAMGSITAADYGIDANADGIGDLSVVVNGRVIGYDDALNLDKDGSGNIMVTAGAGAYLRAANEGLETDISTTGGTTNITVNGTEIIAGEHGIEADNALVSGSMTITVDSTSTITADEDGINANHVGSGDLSITVSGVVTGGNGPYDHGIESRTISGGLANITLNLPAVVSSASGLGIYNNEGDSSISVNPGAAVLGEINLDDGSDDLSFAGGDFSGVTIFNGGDDTDTADGFIDTLTFAGSSGLLIAADVINWENIVIEASSTISFDGIENLVTQNLSSTGTINLQDGVVDDSLSLTGDFAGGGTLNLDTVADDGSGGSDLLIINGDIISGTTTLNITNAGGTGAQTAGDGILVVEANGASPADGFSMTPFTAGGFEYQLVQVGSNWYLQSSVSVNLDPLAIPTLSQWTTGLLTLLLGGIGWRQLRRRIVQE